MADEQHRWLSSDAAEQVLRGEPLNFVDDDTRARADRLTEALDALVPAPPRAGAELPGEAAALAAFRAAREARTVDAASADGRGAHGHHAVEAADAGLVRLGRPVADRRKARFGRPLRLGLAAAMAAGMISGVAVAAGSGVLPTPFSDDPGPAASVSTDATARQLVNSPTPGTNEADGLPTRPADPGGVSGVPTGDGSSAGEASGGSMATGRPGFEGTHDTTGRSQEWWASVRSACRDMAGGKDVGAQRMRGLEDAAGGSGRVKTFCKLALGDHGGPGSGGSHGSGGDGDGRGHHGGDGDQGGDHSGGDDGEGHIWPGGNGMASPLPGAFHPLAPLVPGGTKYPSPSFSAPRPSGTSTSAG
ncbi:hypothetical protein ABZ845_23255 [Streptomyces sp. NPDC047022]|uniref:hypothetical protein n=1 Tax=Streptomyces sp. NPDC047022 TaxID=3155737 RepID=UPI00340A9425